MNRRLLRAMASGLVAAPLAPQAQGRAPGQGRVYRVGVLAPRENLADRLDAFERRLATLGYIQGKNLVIEYRGVPNATDDDLTKLAAELVALRVDVIVTSVAANALAAKRVTTTVPIVMVNAADPVALGLVASLARPGGNVTGLTLLLSTTLVAKQLQLLSEALPKAARVGVLLDTSNPFNPEYRKELEAAAPALNLDLRFITLQSPETLAKAVSEMAEARVQAMQVVPDGRLWVYRVRIAELALRHKLPTMFGLREHVTAGGLMSYGASTFDNYPRAAEYVDRILRGEKPAELPVEQPSRFELVINLKTAKALGLTIPQALLLRADEVIQ